MAAAQGILTVRGGMTSHAAVVARGMGKCCVSGCGEIRWTKRTRSSPRRQDLQRGRLDLSGRLHRQHLRRRIPPLTPQSPASSAASWSGPTSIASSVSAPTPTRPTTPPGPRASAPRASASAAPSTCSSRATASRYPRDDLLQDRRAARSRSCQAAAHAAERL
jgi:hypothetical protein